MGYQPIRNPRRAPQAAAPPAASTPRTPPSDGFAGKRDALAAPRKKDAKNQKDQKPVLTREELAALSGDREQLLQGIAPGSSAALMMQAAFDGNAARMAMLLEKGDTLPGFTNDHGFTPLMVAAARGHAQVVEVLAVHPLTDLGRQHRGGWTALHFAARFGHAKTVASLLAHHAPLGLKTREGKMAHELAEEEETQNVFRESRNFIRFMKDKAPVNTRPLPPQKQEQAQEAEETEKEGQKDDPVKGTFIRVLTAVGLEMKEKPGMNVRARLNEKMAEMDEASFRDAFGAIKATKVKYDWEDVFIKAARAGNTPVMSILQDHAHFEGRALTRALSAAIEDHDQRDAVHHLMMWGADPDASFEAGGKVHKTSILRRAFTAKRAGAFEEMVLWGGLLGGVAVFDDFEKKTKMSLTLAQVSRIRIEGQRAPGAKEKLATALKIANENKLQFAIQLWRKTRELKGTRSKKLKNIFNEAARQDNIGVLMASYAEARRSRLFRGKVEMDAEAGGNAMVCAIMHRRYEFARMLAADGYRIQDAALDKRFELEEKGSARMKSLAHSFMTAKEKPKPIEEIGRVKLSAADAALYTGGMYGMGRFGM